MRSSNTTHELDKYLTVAHVAIGNKKWPLALIFIKPKLGRLICRKRGAEFKVPDTTLT